MNLDAPAPAAEEHFDEFLLDLLYADPEVVDREFEALVAAVWPPSSVPRWAPAWSRGGRGATWPDLPAYPRPRPPVLPGGHPRPVRERSPPAGNLL